MAERRSTRESRVLGKRLLQQKLAAIEPAARKRLQADLVLAGRELNMEQRALVPVDDGVLRASIRTIPFSRGGIGAVVVAGGETTTKPVRKGGPDYDYAMAQELGTQQMLANPFFFPAYRANRAKIRRKVTNSVKKAIRGAVKK